MSGTNLKILATAATTVAVAWVGAWQTSKATGSDGISPNQVRAIVKNESPINVEEKDRLLNTLQAIDDKVTAIQIQQAKDGVNIKILLRNWQTQGTGR